MRQTSCSNFSPSLIKRRPARLEIQSESGRNGADLLDTYIDFKCGKGLVELGDWGEWESLSSYSGGAVYEKTVCISKADDEQIILDLGEVWSSCEVWVNGKYVGTKLTPEWTFDITEFAVNGENRLRIEVYNTLYNHYKTIPTQYKTNQSPSTEENGRKFTKSGIIGPVKVRICK